MLAPFTSAFVNTLAPFTPLVAQNPWISESVPGCHKEKINSVQMVEPKLARTDYLPLGLQTIDNENTT